MMAEQTWKLRKGGVDESGESEKGPQQEPENCHCSSSPLTRDCI